MAVSSNQRPVRLVLTDDSLERSRLTVFFRLILVIPHIVWLLLWGIATLFASIAMWFVVLVKGQASPDLHDFIADYVRYATHVGSYIFLAADPYPGFRGRPGYPVDLEIDPPVEQSRASAGFRLFLALPALLLSAALGGGLVMNSYSSSAGSTGGGNEYSVYASTIGGVASVVAFLAWFVILVRGREPRGFRDLTAYALGYGAQATSYFFLLTPRYPTSDPEVAEEWSELPEHPVRVTVEGGLEHPRLTVLFRLLLAIPHFIWLVLWLIAAFLAVIAAWFAALFVGRVPLALHRFLAAYVRYSMHVMSYVYLVGRRFPGFTGRAGSYEIDAQIDPPEQQSRWKTLFRLFLAIPALLVSSALDGVLLLLAFFGWWYALVTGRVPEGFRNLGASCLRYSTQTYAYVWLLTDRYPYSAPVLHGRREPEHAESPPVLPALAPTPAPALGDAT